MNLLPAFCNGRSSAHQLVNPLRTTIHKLISGNFAAETFTIFYIMAILQIIVFAMNIIVSVRLTQKADMG